MDNKNVTSVARIERMIAKLKKEMNEHVEEITR